MTVERVISGKVEQGMFVRIDRFIKKIDFSSTALAFEDLALREVPINVCYFCLKMV